MGNAEEYICTLVTKETSSDFFFGGKDLTQIQPGEIPEKEAVAAVRKGIRNGGTVISSFRHEDRALGSGERKEFVSKK